MAKLTARRLEPDDLATRVEWFNTPSVYLQMSIETPLSLAGTQRWFLDAVANEHRRDFSFWLQNEGKDTLPVAMGGLVDIDAKHRRAELYIVVKPEMTGHGIGQKCVHWLCNYGFIQLNLGRIYLQTMEDNKGARRLYERCGFVHEGVLRKHAYSNGAFVDRHVQGLIREDWEKQSYRPSGFLSLEMPV